MTGRSKTKTHKNIFSLNNGYLYKKHSSYRNKKSTRGCFFAEPGKTD
ncbi:MAG: hypothetical protein ACI9LK_000256 [Chromatiales bacterium]|jgi:hypothetical protein